jgi:pimeloyl-ACP methyl ester carboxylesterase
VTRLPDLRSVLPGAASLANGVRERTAPIDGVTINYKVGGEGPPVLLLHGFAETSHMWRPLMSLLAGSHTVIAPDLRGPGDSERTVSRYDKKTLARDVRGLMCHLGYGSGQVTVVGHDIGLMVAYAYAAQYPSEVGKLVLMDAFLPGVGDWRNVWLARDLWHFHFSGILGAPPGTSMNSWKSSALAACAPPFSTLTVGIGKEY